MPQGDITVDKRPFSFRQTVRHTDLNGLQDDLERALDTRTRELLGVGIVTGGTVTACHPPKQGQVRISPTIAWDQKGRRIDLRQRFTDRVDAIIPLAALRQEEIADIPKGDGCLLLVAKAAQATQKSFALPFAFAGKTATMGTGADDAHTYKIQAVIETTLGGLVAKQPALLLHADLPQQGYAPGCPPTGTPLTVDVTNEESLTLDIDHYLALLEPKGVLESAAAAAESPLVPPGKHRIVSVIARFARNTFDHRLDGNGESVPHRALEHFAFVIDTSAQADDSGKARPPALPKDGVLLADILLRHGKSVTQEDIDTTRQTRLHGLQDLQPDHTAQLLHMTLFGGGDVHWDGKVLNLPEDVSVSLPQSSTIHTLPTCKIPIAKKHAAWVLLPRQAKEKHTLAVTVLPAGQVPRHTHNQLPWQLAARQENILYGLQIGTFEPSQTKPIAQGLPPKTLTEMQQQIKQAEEADTALQTQQQQYQEQHKEQIQKLEEKLKGVQSTAQYLQQMQRMQSAFSVWTRQKLPGNHKLRALSGMYLASYSGKIEVVAVGYDVVYLDHNYRVWRVHSFKPTYPLNAVCYEPGRIRRLVVGDNGYAATSKLEYHLSSIGNQWSHVSTGVSHTLRACAQEGNLWVVVGDNGTILTAARPDGPWKKQESGTSKNLHAVAGSPGGRRWVVAGEDNTLLASSDGSAWTQAKLPKGFSGSFFTLENCLSPVQLTWNKTQRHFFLFGKYRTLSSADGVDWSLEQSLGSGSGPIVAGCNSQFLAFINHTSYERHNFKFSYDSGKSWNHLFTTNIPYQPTYKSALFCLEKARCFYLLRSDPKTGNSELWQSGFI